MYGLFMAWYGYCYGTASGMDITSIGIITGRRHVFVPHPRHENVAIVEHTLGSVSQAPPRGVATGGLQIPKRKCRRRGKMSRFGILSPNGTMGLWLGEPNRGTLLNAVGQEEVVWFWL